MGIPEGKVQTFMRVCLTLKGAQVLSYGNQFSKTSQILEGLSKQSSIILTSLFLMKFLPCTALAD